MKLAANLSMLYLDSPLLERFKRAKASGFRYVEFLFPYEEDMPVVRGELQRLGLQQILFNLPAGNWVGGERGIAALPDRVDEFRRGVAQAIDIARPLKIPQVNCLVGKRDPSVPLADQQRVMVENLRYSAVALAKAGINMVIEALNPYDVPSYLLTTSRDAFEVIAQVAVPTLKFQYDVYHMQRVEGELCTTIEKNLSRIGHIQIADNPGRHQPGTGEINFDFLLHYLDHIGYGGYVALEYVPSGKTEETLGWIQEYGLQL